MWTYWTAMLASIAILAVGCNPTSVENLAKRPFQAAEVLAFGPPAEKERIVLVPTAAPPPVQPAVPATPAAPSPPPELAAGMRAFRECRYESAIHLFDEAAGDPECTRADRAKANLYGGACCYFAGREEGAIARFKSAMRCQPEIAPSPDEFTPEMVSLFERARAESGTRP